MIVKEWDRFYNIKNNRGSNPVEIQNSTLNTLEDILKIYRNSNLFDLSTLEIFIK